MKNVLIATWYAGNNYGTLLQAFALKMFLEKNNYCVYMQDCYCKEVHTYNDFFATFMSKNISRINRFKSRREGDKSGYESEIKKQEKLISEFLGVNYKHQSIVSDEEIAETLNMIDIFISGGDQIWNPYYLNRHMMFDYVGNEKKVISFGTSIGVERIPIYYKKFYKRMLEKYDFIGVREESSKNELTKLIHKDVKKVIDPTLLIEMDEWDEMIKKYAAFDVSALGKPYILCYFVGNRDYWKYVELIHKETGYKIYIVPVTQNIKKYENKYEYIFEANPLDFLNIIKNAEIICTDSFHATVFSVRYNKELYVLKRFKNKSKKSQNGRIYDFLKQTDRENVIIEDENYFTRYMMKEIPDSEVLLKKKINESKKLLNKEIEN